MHAHNGVPETFSGTASTQSALANKPEDINRPKLNCTVWPSLIFNTFHILIAV